MNTIRVFIMFAVLALAILLTTTNKQFKELRESQVLGDKQKVTEEVSITQTPEKKTDPYNILPMFAYVNGTVVTKSNTSLVMRTSDLPDKVTSWYMDKIANSGMKRNTFIETTTNGSVKNVLVGSRNEGSVEITIVREQGDSFTKIEIISPAS